MMQEEMRDPLQLKSYFRFKGIRKAYGLLWPFIRKRWKAYAVLLFFVLVEIAMMLSFAWFLGAITNAAVDRQFGELRWLVPLGVCLTSLSIVSGFIQNLVEFAAAQAVKKDLTEYLLHHILLLPMQHASRLHSGQLLTYFTQDLHGIHGLLGSNLIHLVRLPILLIAVFIYMFQIHWLMSLLCLIAVPIALLTGALFGILLRENSRAIHQLVENMNSQLSELFQGMQLIRSFTMEKEQYSRFTDQNRELYRLERRSTKLNGWFDAAGTAAGSAAFLICLSFGAYFVSHHIITIGSLLVFVSLTQYAIYPLTGLAELWAGFQRSLTAMERILRVLEQPIEMPELPSYSPIIRTAAAIEFRDVSFRYEGQKRLFQNLNLRIPAGKKAAIVGPSGAGKSTLLHLLQGLYTPESGSILVGGVSTRERTVSELRSSIAHVAQETFLFSGTIRDNLMIARPGITETEMMQAAVHANIHDFILTLPEGYDTKVGERGVRLSGGQKQRLSIARAILKDAPILLLDEATSALDSSSELEVKIGLAHLMKARTTIVVAHRLSTIRDADVIIVLDNGNIVQTGSHDDLVSRDGTYRELHRRQHLEKGGHPHDHEFHSSFI